jgi:hypothetical protein
MVIGWISNCTTWGMESGLYIDDSKDICCIHVFCESARFCSYDIFDSKLIISVSVFYEFNELCVFTILGSKLITSMFRSSLGKIMGMF